MELLKLRRFLCGSVYMSTALAKQGLTLYHTIPTFNDTKEEVF